MTQSELDTFYKNFIKDQPASTIAKHIYNIVSDAVTGGIVRDFNRAEYGPDVRDGITKLTMLIRAYNDLVQAAASKVPADVSPRLTSIESLVAELEAMGVADDPTVTGDNAHAEGQSAVAQGNFSHAEGLSTEATGKASHAEGISSEATKDAAHAEGEKTTASGLNSHAEGYLSKATGHYSHAEGSSTTASGGSSHAEGNTTTASGVNSHAEGLSTVASGVNSHAEGISTVARGNGSHAEGSGTIASVDYQHVQGRYNIEDTTSAFIIGNGTDASHRSNAASIDWNGNAIFAGDVDSGAVKSFAFYKWVIRSTGFVKLPMATEEYARMLHIIGSDDKHYGGLLKCVNGKPVFEYDEIT